MPSVSTDAAAAVEFVDQDRQRASSRHRVTGVDRQVEHRDLDLRLPLPLDAEEATHYITSRIRSAGGRVEDIFLPLSRLLSIYVDATHRLYQAQRQFLGIRDRKVPYIIGIAGSVSGGKSTTARVLQALLSRWPTTPTPGCSRIVPLVISTRSTRVRAS